MIKRFVRVIRSVSKADWNVWLYVFMTEFLCEAGNWNLLKFLPGFFLSTFIASRCNAIHDSIFCSSGVCNMDTCLAAYEENKR